MNQLRHETSPYLLQHADNPVDWHAWNEEALQQAKDLNKPILVSIGYSTCHWCHVMERESFEDEETARLMNDRFVCIKVDREERPDVDRIYMEACQAISGSGGWPLNAFLLPDGRPYYAGTYYPPEAKYNRPSWKDVVANLSDAYRDNYDQVVQQAERLTETITGGGQKLLRIQPEAEDHDGWRTSIIDKLHASFDRVNGGFGAAPKFPMSQTLEALLAHGILHERPQDIQLVEQATLAMLDGGIYDQLGGGFSRYTVDAAWRVPHFEKMLYDNALLLRLLGKLHMTSPNPRYARAIAETTSWLEREMKLPGGGYRAALDADSEGVEGKYYVWELDEATGLLEENEARLIVEFYGLTKPGNWEEEQTNIPYRPQTLLACAAKLGLPIDVARAQLESARNKMHDYRFITRIHPGEDDKVILQWNALLISGWVYAYRATANQRYLELAIELHTNLTTQLYRDGVWHRNITKDQLGAPAFLDDQTALCEARLDLYAATFDESYLVAPSNIDKRDVEAANGAMGIARSILQRFSAESGPMFLLTPADRDRLPVASVDLFDNALPSGNSQFARCLLRLGRLFGDQELTARGEEMLAAMAGSLQRYPSNFGSWLYATLEHAGADRELVVAGPGAAAAGRLLLSHYRPGLLLLASQQESEHLSVLQNRYLPDGLRYYACQHQTCQLPVATPAEALAQLGLPSQQL